MTRIGTWVAGGLMASGLLLAPGAAEACEAHRRPAPEVTPAKATPSDAEPSTRGVERPLDVLDSLMAAKCQCGSKADCTCKKGSCDCGKCKKPKRRVMDALRGQPANLKLDEARYDASAGIFI
ncbi:metallothionein [Myxococcus sp. AM009]|uniref:metallothionein n=1 Tax=unclassified Myxococcus TaxID=2648731 RepID=UPI001595C219|nr:MULTISPECIES: metallothionein [unclassified Myxococcus]NVI97289.1 metallothionein [Myxococcus sp. AM009]NVJ12921.1 metallothionein [Myxococcus sp. AM010]